MMETEKPKQKNFPDDILRLTPSVKLVEFADLLSIAKNPKGDNRLSKTESQV